MRYADIGSRRTADDRDDETGLDTFNEGLFHIFLRKLLTFQVFLHQVVICLNDVFNHFFTPFTDQVFHFARYVRGFKLAARILVVHVCLLFDEVYHSRELVFGTDREGHRGHANVESL